MDLESCLDCKKERGWCKDCKINENFKSCTGTSGNPSIDDFISQSSVGLKFINFKEFNNVENTNEHDAFGKIYSATWIGGIKVTLKRLDNPQNINTEYLKQLYKFHRYLPSGCDADCFGFTKDFASNYMFVMKYERELLYYYIDETQGTLCWRDIVGMVWEILGMIKDIHEGGLIHGNIHGDNLSRLTDKHVVQSTNEIYGVLPYIDPEILKGSPPTKASDIYSFGMIMWTLSAGARPWCNRPHDLNLASEICSGLRPEIVNGTPSVYNQLITQCWDPDPSKRPTASTLYESLYIICHDSDPSVSNQFEIAQEKKFLVSEYEQQRIHPQAFYTSRLLHFPELINE